MPWWHVCIYSNVPDPPPENKDIVFLSSPIPFPGGYDAMSVYTMMMDPSGGIATASSSRTTSVEVPRLSSTSDGTSTATSTDEKQTSRTDSSSETGYMGCYADAVGKRILNGPHTASMYLTPELCREFCTEEGDDITLYGLEWAQE